MSTNIAPSRRATGSLVSRPSGVVVAEARWVEAKAITDALVVRLGRERSELRGAVDEVRVRVVRRLEVSRMLLEDAKADERRAFALLEAERLVCRGSNVAGVRSAATGSQALRSVSTGSGPSASRLRPFTVGTSSRGKRIA